MKKVVKPLIVSMLLVSTTVVFAESFSGAKVKKYINSMDDSGDKKVNFQEFFEDTHMFPSILAQLRRY